MPSTLERTVGTLDRPIFIISSARAGSTMFHRILSANKGVCSLHGESVQAFNTFHSLPLRSYRSHGLTEEDADAFTAQFFRHHFYLGAMDYRRRPIFRAQAGATIRFVEKTPNNILRVRFLKALFPDGLFILLVRDGRAVVSSLIEGWNQGTLAPYRLPERVVLDGYEREGQDSDGWCYTLIEGWANMLNTSIEEVCARQFQQGYDTALADLEAVVPPEQRLTVSYEDALSKPQEIWERVLRFADLTMDDHMMRTMENPGYQASTSAPSADKWRRLYPERIERILPIIEPTMRRLGYSL